MNRAESDRAAIDRYVVIGHPVEHSQSPFIHTAFARQTGQALRYERLWVPLDGFEPGLRALAASGARGCNVTMPFKFAAHALAARRSERAALAEAANVLRFDAAGWLADNTDGIGLVRDIEHHAARPIRGARVLLLGAGGAAAGVLGPLLGAAPAEVVVANRTPASAAGLVERHMAVATAHAVRLQAAPLGACGRGFDLVVNATASSLQGAAVPVDSAVLGPGALFVDMAYGAAAAPSLAWAAAHGAEARDGLGMLVEQAAAAFELWRGVRPETAAVLADLRRRIGAGGSTG